MDPFAQALQSNSKTQSAQKNNTFSPEFEQSLDSDQPTQAPQKKGVNPLSEALARTGGSPVDTAHNTQNQPSAEELKTQQEEAERKRKKEALRQKLHKEINPVELTDLYNATEARTKKELEQVRQELRMFALEVSKFYKEVDVATFGEVVNPGQTGAGLRTYYQKLREFIKLLRKKIRSARTWMQTQNGKSKKKQARKGRKGGAGIEIGGAKHEQTKAVFDQMHQEQSTAYSGF